MGGYSFDSGWLLNEMAGAGVADWTNVHLGNDPTDATDNLTHNLGAPLSDLLVKVLISTDGIDANSFEVPDTGLLLDGYNRQYGITIFDVDDNNLKIQTAADGFRYINDAGANGGIEIQNWYYKIKVYKLTVHNRINDMIGNIGNIEENKMVYLPFNTYDSAGDSCTVTNLANTDVHIHKNGSVVQRTSAAGITVYIDFDGITGNHLITIDTSDNTHVGFYSVDSDYKVRVEGITVGTQTINAWIGIFSIENRFDEVDVTKWLGTPAATPTIAGVPEVDQTHLGGSQQKSDDLKEFANDVEDVKALLKCSGNIFYVSKSGDNSDGTTWAKAKTTIDAAIALCTPDNGDQILIDSGTYDEVSATAGVLCDVAGIKIIGVLPGVIVKNTNTTNGSKVFSVTVDNVWIHNIFAEKGETTSDNAIVIDVNGAGISADVRDVTIAVEKSNHTGIRFTGGAVGTGYVNNDMQFAYIYSAAGVGTGIEFANCSNCAVIDAQFHTLTTAIKFTGGANCHDNLISPQAMVSSCGTGISLSAGCLNNMLSALILNTTTEYSDNSGNETNKTEGSLTYVLSDIREAILEVSPQTHYADSNSAVTYGTVDAGTYADTTTDNDVYWQISPVAVNGLDMFCQFDIGTGRIPTTVSFNGRFDAQVLRYCEVDAYNYLTNAYEVISSADNRIDHATSDSDRQFVLTTEHVKSDGEVKIRVRSTSVTIGDDLYIDMLVVNSVEAAAGGLTASLIRDAVLAGDVTTHEDHNSLAFNIGSRYLHRGQITGVTSQTIMTDSTLPAVIDLFNDHVALFHDHTNNTYCMRAIKDMDNAGQITLYNAPAITVDTSTYLFVLSQKQKVNNINDSALVQINAEIVDALNVDTYAEPGQEAPAAINTLVTKIGYIFKFLRNKITNDGTDIKVYNDAGAVADQKASVSEAGGVVTRGKFGSGA